MLVEIRNKEDLIKYFNSKITDNMSPEKKYKIIFDWMIRNFGYDYGVLYSERANALSKEAYFKYRNKLRKYFSMIDINLENIERVKETISLLQENNEDLELIELKIKEYDCLVNEKEFYQKHKINKNTNIFETHVGVCFDFAEAFKEVCKEFNLPCDRVSGSILSGEEDVGHAWNVVEIDGEVKYIDLSSAIHCIDGTNKSNLPYDFFLKTFNELLISDNGKNRKIY